MRFQVLGDVALVVDGHPVQLSSRRQEQLLALLICAQGRTIAPEALIDAMWRERLEARSGKNLQVLVHRLRRTLDDPERIRHDRSGYALSAQTGEVDAWHFTDLTTRAKEFLNLRDPETAHRLLGEALGLWCGRAFSGLDDVAPLAAAAEQLEQDRKRVLLERIDIDLALGRHTEIIPELVSMVAEDPLAERVVARLMVATYRAGRRTEALRIYRQTRAVLAEELGVEPGPQLHVLQQAILRGDVQIGLDSHRRTEPAGGRPAAAPPAPAPFLLPAPVSDLTGRDDELRRLTTILRGRVTPPALTATSTSAVATAKAAPAFTLSELPLAPVICAVSGMPGVGKSALAVRAAHEVRGEFPDGQLYVNLRGAETGPVTPAHALGRFLRALGLPGTTIPDGLDERAEVFRAHLSGRRVLVLLDDVADESQIEPLLPSGGGCAVLVTSRSALTALPALPSTHRFVLGVLESTAAVELLSTITGRSEMNAGGATAEQLAELCGRLPLALRIAGARLAARPHWTVERLVSRLAAEHNRLDELTYGALSVRAGLALGYSGLSETCRVLFRRLGLLETPDFAGWIAAVLLDAEPHDAEDVLEALLEAQLVEYAGVDGIGEPRYRVHDLVRLHARERGVADEPPGATDAALTRLTGAYLSLAEQAHRRQYGGDYTVLHGGGPRWDCGPATSRRLLADPAAWLRSERLGLVAAVDAAARLDLSETCWDLAMTAITLFEAQGYFDDWRHTCETALSVALRVGDPRGEAAMRYALGTLELFRQCYTAAQPHFDVALSLFETVNDRHGQALTLCNAALIERVEGRAGTALRRYRRALRMLREVGDLHAEAHVLGSIAQIHIEHGRPEPATLLLETALAVYLALSDLRGVAQILNRTGALYLRQGLAEQAEIAYRRVRTTTLVAGDRIGEAYGLLGIGEARLLAGDLDGATARLRSALRIATEVGEPFLVARARLAGGRVAAGRDDLESARALLGQAVQAFTEIGLPVWCGRAREALHALDEPRARPPMPC
ncbi:AfsR/SARP family transcriptional regulator [Streptosporangium sp. CA-115845]|uniref:AfsR/SARP family transcriptional regulator n=1 Tax=Streptosporangium sp. CA-115845 TaxID=3240071 RepID=UPI003D8B4109